MEVRPLGASGCLLFFLGVMTLGVAPLGIWLSMRSWPALLDEEGLTLRNGTRLRWADCTRVVEVHTLINGQHITSRHDFAFGGRTVPLVSNRLQQGQEVLTFALARVPAAARTAE